MSVIRRIINIVSGVVFVLLLLATVLFMLVDRGTVKLNLSPFPKEITVQLNEALLGFFALGLFLGMLIFTAYAVCLKMQIWRLSKENKRLSSHLDKE